MSSEEAAKANREGRGGAALEAMRRLVPQAGRSALTALVVALGWSTVDSHREEK